MRTSALPLSAAAVTLVLGLAGCAGGATSELNAAPSSAPPAPTESGSAAATPAPTTDAPEVQTPVECEPLDLTAGTVAGSDLGPCLRAVVVRDETGTVTISGDELAGTVDYRYTPTLEFRGDLETGAGPASISVVDGVTLVDEGDGPIVADLDAADPGQKEAGSTADAYRVYCDPGFIGDLVEAGKTWKVSAARQQVETPDGSVEAYRVDSEAPYSWFGIPVESYTVWVTAEGRPVATESTTAFLGRSATLSQKLSRVGEPVTISPLS